MKLTSLSCQFTSLLDFYNHLCQAYSYLRTFTLHFSFVEDDHLSPCTDVFYGFLFHFIEITQAFPWTPYLTKHTLFGFYTFIYNMAPYPKMQASSECEICSLLWPQCQNSLWHLRSIQLVYIEWISEWMDGEMSFHCFLFLTIQTIKYFVIFLLPSCPSIFFSIMQRLSQWIFSICTLPEP